MRKITFNNDKIYHIYNRGVEKRNIFLDQRDYLRFMINLHEFNSRTPSLNLTYSLEHIPIEVRLRYKKEDPLVHIFAFCLMPNHYHLMIQQVSENGITEFMRKIGTGYTNYFNIKRKRVGPLFQGKFKATALEHEEHFFHLPHYIHLNPLKLIPSIKNVHKKRTSIQRQLHFLMAYRWSSLKNYLGEENFPTIINKNFLVECIGKPKEFTQATREWIAKDNLELITKISIDDDPESY